MSVETAIRARLVADATVSGLIGTRAYALVLPQETAYPAITYNRVSGVRVHDLDGPAGRGTPRISVNSWAETYLEAKALAAAVRVCLDGFRGTVGGVEINNISIENEIDLFEEDAGLSGTYRIMQDYFISHRE